MAETQTQIPSRTGLSTGWLITLIVASGLAVGSYILWHLFGKAIQPVVYELVTPTFWLFVGAGFLAQTIDGALGMAMASVQRHCC